MRTKRDGRGRLDHSIDNVVVGIGGA